MEIINLNNIEQIVLCKYEIEQQSGIKVSLTDFINQNIPNDVYFYSNVTFPFALKEYYGKQYLFIVSEDESVVKRLINKLKLCKYDTNNLTEVSNTDMINMEDDDKEFFIINNKYYK